MIRPQPPTELTVPGFGIEPSTELADWALGTFVKEGGPLCNEEHAHLRAADIAFLWTNVEYEQDLMPVAGMAEIVKVNGKPWPRAERVEHLCLLHGNIPQARIWIYAPYAVNCDDNQFCALVEHELYHIAQKTKDGEPKFDDEGKPELTMRAHDVGEFIGVVERYGLPAVHPNVRRMVEAAKHKPLLAVDSVHTACGTCRAAKA